MSNDPVAYAALMEELADVSLRASDADVLDEVAAAGGDPVAEAEQVRGFLRQTGKDFRQRHLRAAAAEYKRRVRALSTRWVDLPDGPDERRALLAAAFARAPAMQAAFLTVQHREFKELTDADVESCLVQLLELGALKGLGSEDGGEE